LEQAASAVSAAMIVVKTVSFFIVFFIVLSPLL
jgi:hypothetical protein